MLFPLIHEFQQLLPNMEVPNNCSVHKDLMMQTRHCSYPAYPAVVSIEVIKIVNTFQIDSPLFPSPCLATLCKDSSNPGVVTKDRHGWKQSVVYIFLKCWIFLPGLSDKALLQELYLVRPAWPNALSSVSHDAFRRYDVHSHCSITLTRIVPWHPSSRLLNLGSPV